MKGNEEIIEPIFVTSGFENLRSLKQFLWDFEKLWKVLTPTQREHAEAMQHLLTLTCALSLELRAGETPVRIIRQAGVSHCVKLRMNTPGEDTKQDAELFAKYPMVDFASTLIHPTIIVGLVLESNLPSSSVQEQLLQHPYFATPGEMPSWRALWHAVDAPPSEHPCIIARFEADFEARAFKDEAEVYHVIGLGLWLSDLGISGWEAASVVERLRRYISDVYAQGEAGPDEASEPHPGYPDGGSFGLAYRNLQDPRYRDLQDYHREQRTAWKHRAYPTIADELHQLMKDDSGAFLRDVCFTDDNRAKFAKMGILSHIPSGQFAQSLADLPFRDQKTVARALSLRYQHAQSEPELSSEMPWLREVRRHLEHLYPTMAPIPRYYLSRLVKDYVDAVSKEETVPTLMQPA